ncbi:GNAT family N-acetyltransferase [Butyrivibrio sp. LB2008]|uniref:GNAT family N-acetyltransferase n=1 Tax=Butyrivibrio sp. LB2008 TaxID=1408305 RepID=UPI000479DD8D|nr:GNAT family N-acetyltransferase [Butyrivibrio sp. LB2008]
MKYNKIINLKNGREALLRNGEFADGEAVFVNFNETHAETDYLLSYPDENSFDAQQEAEFLKEKTESPNEIEIVAVVDGVVAGTAGIEAVGAKYKLKHRAELGIAILKEYWGLGIGKALMEACIECAKDAGYTQLELNVVAENERAVSLYKKMGFVEYGRNPRGFNSRVSGYQEIVYMLLEL